MRTHCLFVFFPGWESSARLVAGESQHLLVDPQTEQDKRWHHDDILSAIADSSTTYGVPVHAIRWCLATWQTVEVKVRFVIVGNTQECLLCQNLHTMHSVLSTHTVLNNWLPAILLNLKKGKFLSYSLPSIGPGADPGVQAVSPQVTFKSSPAVGCHYFPPGLRLPSQPNNATILRPVPSYAAWWQRQIGVNNLASGNWSHDILIASPTPYCYATAPPIKHVTAF